MRTQTVAVVSIHPDLTRPLGIDIKDILRALGTRSLPWVWCVRNVDWLGDDADGFCRAVDAIAPRGFWISSQDLLAHADRVYQTIEGEFLAFPNDIDPDSVTVGELDLREFPVNRCELAIMAIEGGPFEIFMKDPEILADLKNLADVRDENPADYF